MTCGQHNLIRNPLDEMEDEAPSRGRGSAQGGIHASATGVPELPGPWHNMYREGPDRWGHTAFICMQCHEVNRVVANRRTSRQPRTSSAPETEE